MDGRRRRRQRKQQLAQIQSIYMLSVRRHSHVGGLLRTIKMRTIEKSEAFMVDFIELNTLVATLLLQSRTFSFGYWFFFRVFFFLHLLHHHRSQVKSSQGNVVSVIVLAHMHTNSRKLGKTSGGANETYFDTIDMDESIK